MTIKITAAIAKHKTAILLFFIFLLGLALRLYKLDFQSLWLDEYVNIKLALEARNPIVGFQFIPPLYILILKLWLKFIPLTETSVRLPGALIGAFSIIIFYFLAKELFNHPSALLSSFLLAISTIHVVYCQEAKYYPLTLAMAMMMQLSYLRIIKYRHRVDFLIYGAASVIGLYTYYYLIILFFIHLVHLLLHRKSVRPIAFKIILAQIISVAFFLPCIVHIFSNLKDATSGSWWIPQPTPYSMLETTIAMFAGENWPWHPLPFLNTSQTRMLYFIFIGCMVLTLIRQRKTIKKWEPAISLVLLWSIVPTLFFYIFSKTFFSLYHIRYILTTALALYLLLGWLVISERRAALKLTLVFLFIVINLCSLQFYFTHPERTQNREAALYLREHVAKNDRILVYGYERGVMQFYFTRFGLNNQIAGMPPPSSVKNINIQKYEWFLFVWRNEEIDKRLCLDKQLFGIEIYKRCQ